MSPLQWLTALMPVLSVAILLVALRIPAAKAMPVALAITAVLALTVWKVDPTHVEAAVIEGLIIALSVVLIVFGALAFLGVMRAGGGLAAIRLEFMKISPDSRVQLMFVGWLLVCFIEGAAGFGTPAPVAAPLLMALGFPAMAAVCLALIADVSAVTFGAVGTPIIVGIGQGTGRNYADVADAAQLKDVALHAAGMDIVAGLMVPVLMLLFLTVSFAKVRSTKAFVEALPLAVVSALAYSIPAFFWTKTIGVEFGGILGGATGIVVLFILTRFGILTPKRVWTVRDGYLDDERLAAMRAETAAAASTSQLASWKVWAPYGMLTVLLLATRLIAPVKDLLNSVDVGMVHILGTPISSTFQPLYSPGTLFLVVVLLTVWLHRIPRANLQLEAKPTATAVLGTAIVLGAAVPMVRVFLNSEVNAAGLDSMPLELASAASAAVGTMWPLVAPWVGSLGAFVSGSATFSHLMFASLQENIATTVGLDPITILAQQVGGGNAGNMVCVSNVVAVAGVGGLLGREGEIIAKTGIPMAVYVITFGLLGLALAS